MAKKGEDLKESGNIIFFNTIKKLTKHGFNVKGNALPFIDYSLKKIRSKEEVCRRIVILYSLKALSLYPEDMLSIKSFLKSGGYIDFMSSKEITIFKQKKITYTQEIEFSWYKESLYVLLWYSNIIEDNELNFPTNEVILDKKYLDILPPECDFGFFKAKISLREYVCLIEELYFYYYLNWIVKKDQLSFLQKLFIGNDKKKLNKSVIIERRKALEWIVDSGLDWDDISLDT